MPADTEARIGCAEASELPELCALLTQLLDLEQDFTPDPERQIAGLRLMLESPGAVLLTAKRGGRIAGFCGVQLLISTAMGGYSAQIEDLVLHPEFRRQGIGRKLLEAAAQWAKRRGAVRLQLNCDDLNLPAQSFYTRYGWERTHLYNYFKFDF